MATWVGDGVQPQGRGKLRYASPWLLVFVAAWAATLGLGFAEPVQLVAQHWPLVIVGFFGALVGNATAVGGGLVFIPVMMLIYQFDPVDALKLAIVAQSFGMTSGAIGWLQGGQIPRGLLTRLVPLLLIGCVLGTVIVSPTAVLVKGVFGPVSIGIGVLTLLVRGRSGERSSLAAEAARWPLWLAALSGGLLTGWVAIGAGEFVGACLMLVYGMQARAAIGVGVVALSVCSLFLLGLHALVLGNIPWDLGMFVGLGCVFGARLGPYVALSVQPRTLKLGFAAVAIGDGTLVLIQFLRGL